MKPTIHQGIQLAMAMSFILGMPATGGEPRLEFRQGDKLMLAWQVEPLAEPKGGGKFAASAFIHPLCTPDGFACTNIQPSDHLHHPLANEPGKAEWELHNETVIKKQGAAPEVVIHETARMVLTAGTDATVLDISLRQKAAGAPVTIPAYRYSGFSWRGPASWNKDNSTMTTSGGKGRDDANGTPARWLMVSGPALQGTATVLILSAAEKLAGTTENLRVWDSKTHNGAPFVNFNPVMKEPLPLDDAHPAVSHRKYRVIAADRVIDAATADAEWRKWTGS